jgi:hypothetical protein
VSATLYGPEFFVGRTETVVLSASVVVPLIIGLVIPETLLDVGCGQGEWVDAFREKGVDAWGVDIAAPDHPNLARHDLTEPLNLGRDFDVVLCLETGEHLPEDAAETLVDTIVRHADTVVFGAAVVGQEGIGHINCQPHEYWHAKFAARGYETHDELRPHLFGDERVSPWYRNNIFVYERPL